MTALGFTVCYWTEYMQDYVVKERDYAEATLKASQNLELERDLKSAMEYAGNLKPIYRGGESEFFT